MDPGDRLVGVVIADRYRLGRLLGRGGMAEVRQGDDLRLGRAVAVKFLDAALAARPELRRRFEDEARSAARLNHPAVVQVFDSGEWEGRPFLVMEMLSGRTLAAELAAGALPVSRVRNIAGDVLGALAAAHAAGVIHRDVKPANLLLTADGSVKVSDFGIAKADPMMGGSDDTGAATMTGQVLGTPSYIAPERLTGHPATAASDVWSVGVVCWEALAGRRAFGEGAALTVGMAVMSTDLAPVLSVRPDCDPWLARAVDGALRRDPAQRWPSAVAMREVLLTGTTAIRPGGGAPPAGPPAGPPAVAAGVRDATVAMARPATVVSTVSTVPGGAPLRTGTGRAGLLAFVAVLLLAAIAAVATVLIRGNNGPGSRADSNSTTVPGAATTTQAPATTLAPTTEAPTTAAPTTTEAPTTVAPTTTVTPTTVVPTTVTPTTTLGGLLGGVGGGGGGGGGGNGDGGGQ